MEGQRVGELERHPPDPNDSRLTGLDVFPRPASPGLQLLPWRESSLDGLGASGKVRGQRNLGRGFVGSGLVSPFWLCLQFPYPSSALSWISTPSPTLFCFSLSFFFSFCFCPPLLLCLLAFCLDLPCPFLHSSIFHPLRPLVLPPEPFLSSFLPSFSPRTTSPAPLCPAITRSPLWPTTGVLMWAATADHWAPRGRQAPCPEAGSLSVASPCLLPARNPAVPPASAPSPSA